MMTMQEIIAKAPPGTSGRMAYFRGCWYGVAAHWHDAEATVWFWCRTGKWVATRQCVADFRHRPKLAMWQAMLDARVPYRRGRGFCA